MMGFFFLIVMFNVQYKKYSGHIILIYIGEVVEWTFQIILIQLIYGIITGK